MSKDGRYLFVSRPSFADVVSIDLGTRQLAWRTPVEGVRADHAALVAGWEDPARLRHDRRKVHAIDTTSGDIIGSFDSGDGRTKATIPRTARRSTTRASARRCSCRREPGAGFQGERVFQVVDAQSLQGARDIRHARENQEGRRRMDARGRAADGHARRTTIRLLPDVVLSWLLRVRSREEGHHAPPAAPDSPDRRKKLPTETSTS